jgi:hypothetical protein
MRKLSRLTSIIVIALAVGVIAAVISSRARQKEEAGQDRQLRSGQAAVMLDVGCNVSCNNAAGIPNASCNATGPKSSCSKEAQVLTCTDGTSTTTCTCGTGVCQTR